MIARLIATFFIIGSALGASAATPIAEFAGHWTFDPAHSRNIGMMGGMAIHTTIVQTQAELTVSDLSDFNGQKDTQHTVYNLTGKPVTNTPIMGGVATTRSRWQASRLITEWESPGSIAGTIVKRTETRYLSPDHSTMFVESSRPGQTSMVMVFTRDR